MSKKFIYFIEESGRERHEGEFNSVFSSAETPELAIKKFEEIKAKILSDKDFFLKDDFDGGNWKQHNAISSNGVELPVFSIESGEEYYELYVAETELIEGECYGRI